MPANVIVVDRRNGRNRIAVNHRHIALSNKVRVELQKVKALYYQIKPLAILNPLIYRPYLTYLVAYAERLQQRASVMKVPKTRRFRVASIFTIAEAISHFGPTLATFENNFGLTPAGIARFFTSRYLGLFTQSEEEEAMADGSIESLYSCRGKVIYDPRRRQNIHLVQAFLLSFNTLRTDSDVSARSRNFGIANSAVSVQVNHAAFRLVKFYGYLLKPNIAIPKFASRFRLYNQVIYNKLISLPYYSARINLDVRDPFDKIALTLDGTFMRVSTPSEKEGDLQHALWNGYYRGVGFLHLIVWAPDGLAVCVQTNVGSTNDNGLVKDGRINELLEDASEYFALGDSIFGNRSRIVRVPNERESQNWSKQEVLDVASIRSFCEHGFKDLRAKNRFLTLAKKLKLFWTRTAAIR